MGTGRYSLASPFGAHVTRHNGGLVVKWDPSYGLVKDYRGRLSRAL
jgi:hypothetical protein